MRTLTLALVFLAGCVDLPDVDTDIDLRDMTDTVNVCTDYPLSAPPAIAAPQTWTGTSPDGNVRIMYAVDYETLEASQYAMANWMRQAKGVIAACRNGAK